MRLRYGTNPHQRPATATAIEAGQEPLRLVHGEPSYINLLDALTAWQLVREASQALARPAAASFKHVSPAGAAIAGPVDVVMADTYRVDPTTVGAVTSAYLARPDRRTPVPSLNGYKDLDCHGQPTAIGRPGDTDRYIDATSGRIGA